MTATCMMPPAALADATYRKSSRSSAAGNCVAVGRAGDWVGIQDTKQGPDSTRRTTVAVPITAFTAFLAAVKTS